MMEGPSPALLHKQMRIITVALASGVVIFGAVMAVLIRSGTPAAWAVDGPMRWGIALLGMVLLGAAHVIANALTQGPRDGGPTEVARRLQTGFLAGQAMRESVGLVGAVAGFLTGDLVILAALSVASVVTMLVALPHRATLEHRLRKAAAGPS